MSPIEADPLVSLVRQALAETPTTTATTDPLTALDRRVRKARRWLAAGAGAAAAAVAAAVVVPLAVLSGGSGSPNTVTVGRTPAPAPSNPPGVTTWWPSGVVWVAPAQPHYGGLWALVRGDSGAFVAPVNPNGLTERFPVSEPADVVAPGTSVEWVAGNDSSANRVRLSVLDNGTRHVDTMTFQGALVGVPVSVGDALYLVASDANGVSVKRFVLSNDGIDQTGTLPVAGASEIASTEQGHLWALAGHKLVEVVADRQGLSSGSTVDWTGDIYSKTGASTTDDTIWAYDGARLIGLAPKNLAGCVSCAEGYRLNVAGRPAGVATADDDSVFVAVSQASTFGKQAGLETGIAYYSADDLGSGSPTETLFGIQVTSVVADGTDGAGGVDYVDDHGRLQHWDPQITAAAR